MTDLYDPKNLSPWQDGKPYRVGVYEVDEADCHGRAFAYWDGRQWFNTAWEGIVDMTISGAISRAYEYGKTDLSYPDDFPRYRGLLFNPEEKKCQCSMRTKVLGDGCAICNPEYAADHGGEK